MRSAGPAASIVIPIYNTDYDVLLRSVKSALKQTCGEIEVVLVDDGSKMETAHQCDELASLDSRITVIHQDNAGLSAARNAGVNAASGKWVMFLDADDWLSIDAIERCVDAGERNQVELVMSAWVKDYAGRSVAFPLDYDRETLFDRDACKELMIGLFDWNSRYHDITGKLFLREFLINKRIEHDAEIRMGSESLLFNIRAFHELSGACYIPLVTYHYIQNDDSISTKYSNEYREGLSASYRRTYDLITGYENAQDLKVALNRHLPNVVAALSVGCAFAPNSILTYREACQVSQSFRSEMLEIIGCNDFDYAACSTTRKMANMLIRLRCYPLLKVMALIRAIQKAN